MVALAQCLPVLPAVAAGRAVVVWGNPIFESRPEAGDFKI